MTLDAASPAAPDHEEVVRARYGAAATQREAYRATEAPVCGPGESCC